MKSQSLNVRNQDCQTSNLTLPSGLYKPTLMWLGSTVFLVGGRTGSGGGGDSDLLEANAEVYVLRPSGAFEPYRDWMESIHSGP